MKLNKREIVILIVTVGLVIVFMLYRFVAAPMREGAVDVNDRLRQVYRELAKAKALLAQGPLVEDKYRRLVQFIGTADSDDAQMPAIVADVESAARDGNVHIANIQPQKSIIQKEALFLPVELEIDGQWQDIARFIALLQQHSGLYFINEVNLEKYSGAVSSLRGRLVISRMCLN